MNYQSICLSMCDIAKKAGAFIASERLHFDLKTVESKGLHDLVSYVDKTSEKLIVEALGELLPEAGFITEEGTSTKQGKRYQWIIDPLDGTTNFVSGIPIYAVSIGLVEDQETVAGVVYEIGQQECFYAWKGSEAYLNGTTIHVSETADMQEALLATGFPYSNFSRIDNYLALLKWGMIETRGIRRLGSAATDLAYVACGRFDVFFEYDLKPWDVCAGAFIVKQAGGRVFDFAGGNDYLFGKEITASNAALHHSMLEKIHTYFR
ncbi:MAG: inositol monophosphatase family protein [Microbacter sp.]